jgi:NAD(P)-dependent dehydrogenase (short-subunit alcohol dehydrogenase family)
MALKRFCSPAEVSSVIYFLLTEDSSYINGQIINVDGGTVFS